MPTSTSPPLTLSTSTSPKRKRPTTEPHPFNPPPTSRIRTSAATPSSPSPGPSSPRMSVAGRLQNLDINELTPLDFSPSATTFTAQITPLYAPPTPPKPLTPPREEELEVPETPRLKPTVLPEVKDQEGERLWWSEAEITGHDPKDPADDGEGINGVGFLPTPAIAHARAERRKRQVKDWKEREAREARQKRSERRRRRDVEESLGAMGKGESGEEGRKVRFLEA